jgi:hypothetical protein
VGSLVRSQQVFDTNHRINSKTEHASVLPRPGDLGGHDIDHFRQIQYYVRDRIPNVMRSRSSCILGIERSDVVPIRNTCELSPFTVWDDYNLWVFTCTYEDVSKRFRTGRLERELLGHWLKCRCTRAVDAVNVKRLLHGAEPTRKRTFSNLRILSHSRLLQNSRPNFEKGHTTARHT